MLSGQTRTQGLGKTPRVDIDKVNTVDNGLLFWSNANPGSTDMVKQNSTRVDVEQDTRNSLLNAFSTGM